MYLSYHRKHRALECGRRLWRPSAVDHRLSSNRSLWPAGRGPRSRNRHSDCRGWPVAVGHISRRPL